MSIVSSGGTLITPPACVPARYTLFSVAEVEDRPETAGHWQAGFSHDNISCGDLVVVSPCIGGENTTENKEDAATGLATEDGDPFTVVAGYECSVPGRSVTEAWDLAEEKLTRGEVRAVERAFWTGQDSNGNEIRESLGGTNAGAVDITPTPGTAVSITDGFALMENWAGENNPCTPVFHANRGLATYLAERRLIEADGEVMRAVGTGSRVVVGGGYQLTGPVGDVPGAGESWLYVSGGIKILRSPTFFTPERQDTGGAVDRVVNDITVFAERTYGILLGECGIAAVLVNLCSVNC